MHAPHAPCSGLIKLAFSVFLEGQGMQLDEGLDIIHCLWPTVPEEGAASVIHTLMAVRPHSALESLSSYLVFWDCKEPFMLKS
jgi:hypothetical protein